METTFDVYLASSVKAPEVAKARCSCATSRDSRRLIGGRGMENEETHVHRRDGVADMRRRIWIAGISASIAVFVGAVAGMLLGVISAHTGSIIVQVDAFAALFNFVFRPKNAAGTRPERVRDGRRRVSPYVVGVLFVLVAATLWVAIERF
jgi:hypothetical protein